MSKARELAELGAVYDSGALSNRNLVINGDMRIAQRGTSSTAANYQTIDRFRIGFDSSQTVTQSQQSLTSSDDPYSEGFKYYARVLQGGANSAATDFVQFAQRVEGYTAAACGWNVASTSSYITFSCWVRSSLAGTYYAYHQTRDTSSKYYNQAFTLAANTWKKITVTMPGYSGGSINNDNTSGIELRIVPYFGTDYTDSSIVSDAWYDVSGSNELPDFAQNWCNTSGATFDTTGWQLEVGPEATPFEHRSFGDELARCQRYYEKSFDYDTAPAQNTGAVSGALTVSGVSTSVRTLLGHVDFAVHKRAVPTITRYNPFASGTGWSQAGALDISSGTYGVGTNGFNMRVEGSATVTNTNLLINWTADAEI